jgi:hypothetical protein
MVTDDAQRVTLVLNTKNYTHPPLPPPPPPHCGTLLSTASPRPSLPFNPQPHVYLRKSNV